MSDSSSRPTLRELGPAQRFEGAYAISNAQLGTTRSGKPYLRCLLGDRTGKLPARMWNCSEELFRRIPHEGFVYAQGETQPFEGELQLIVHQIDPHEPTPEQLRELLPSTDRDVEQMFQEVVQLLQTLEHPAMRALAQTYLADEMLMDLFKQAPAAKSMHHAYLGGLLEHTLNLLKAADLLLPLYPGLNRDIVLMGLFLHDLGKTRELVFDRGFSYSDRGELIGHIVDGAIMLHDKAQQTMVQTGVRLPTHALNVLEHIILSHHGQPEFGAARVPSTPEAIFVSLLDNLDAKTAIALEAARRGEKAAAELRGNFTERHWALGAKVFRPDPLA